MTLKEQFFRRIGETKAYPDDHSEENPRKRERSKKRRRDLTRVQR